MVKVIEKLMKKVYDALYSEKFKEKHRMRKEDFTRNRKLGFGEICLVILKSTKTGLQAGIQTFVDSIRSDVDSYSKAAFSKARQRISPDAFKEIFQLTVAEFYESAEYKTYRGYRVCAIDGSELNLPNTDELLGVYGSQPYGQGTTQVQSRVSCLYDVLNHVVIDAEMYPCRSDERKNALAHLSYLDNIRTEKELLLMDRGYPSEELLLQLEHYSFKYVIRANKKEFFREVRDVKRSDEIVVRQCKNGAELRIRVVELELDNGTKETLLTNIFDSDYSIADFGEIYNLRWRIEEHYDTLKNKLLVEKFSGISPVCVQQDFYASLFLANLLAYMELECAESVKRVNEESNRKHTYKINTTQAVAELKLHVVELIVTDSTRKRLKILRYIRSELMKNLLPIRPGRSFDRKNKHPSVKFPQNRKLY